MRKIILSLLALTFIFAKPALAGNLSVKLEQPKTPTNLNTFNLTFVALDMVNNPVNVKCFKQGPGDSGFNQFAEFNLSNGGNTDSCPVTSSIVSSQGIYNFKVSASDDSETLESSTVSIDYRTDGPGTPVSYSKEQIDNCTWKIKFTTASDGGKTVRVEAYRSSNPSYSADLGNRFANIGISSNNNGEASITVPDCSKTWYFSVRAFDSVGNGSGVIGDSQSVTVVNNTTSTTQSKTGGAILSNGTGNSVGEEKPSDKQEGVAPTDTTKENGDATPEVKGASTDNNSKLFLRILEGITLVAIGYVFFFKKNKKK